MGSGGADVGRGGTVAVLFVGVVVAILVVCGLGCVGNGGCISLLVFIPSGFSVMWLLRFQLLSYVRTPQFSRSVVDQHHGFLSYR